MTDGEEREEAEGSGCLRSMEEVGIGVEGKVKKMMLGGLLTLSMCL